MRPNANWFKGETKRQMLFPFPVDIVRKKLQSGFKYLIAEPKGLLFTKDRYEGRIRENTLHLDFTRCGRTWMAFTMDGELFADQSGTRLEMIVKNSRWVNISLVAVALLICIYKGFSVGLLIAVLFAIINFIVIAWHRSEAAHKISAKLNEIISNTV